MLRRRDDVAGPKRRRPATEVIECGGAARRNLCRRRPDAEERGREQRRQQENARSFLGHHDYRARFSGSEALAMEADAWVLGVVAAQRGEQLGSLRKPRP